MRLVIKSFHSTKTLLDCDCSSIVDVARSFMDFVNNQLDANPSAESISFICVLKRQVKDDVIAFDFTPYILKL